MDMYLKAQRINNGW